MCDTGPLFFVFCLSVFSRLWVFGSSCRGCYLFDYKMPRQCHASQLALTVDRPRLLKRKHGSCGAVQDENVSPGIQLSLSNQLSTNMSRRPADVSIDPAGGGGRTAFFKKCRQNAALRQLLHWQPLTLVHLFSVPACTTEYCLLLCHFSWHACNRQITQSRARCVPFT